MNESRPIDPFSYYPRLERLKAYIERNYSEPITVSEAAEIAALETKYFSTYFRKKAGSPFSQWLREFRVEKAKELMRQRDLSITEVAFEVGFHSLGSFIRAFKSHEGITPSAFKKSLTSMS